MKSSKSLTYILISALFLILLAGCGRQSANHITKAENWAKWLADDG